MGPLAIGPLISPLRYDILVRADHFAFHEEHEQLFHRDFEGYVAAAGKTPYFTWFHDIVCPAYLPHLVGRPDRLWEEFGARLGRAALLHESFERSGFDVRFPVGIHAPSTVVPTSSGKLVSRRVFPGNGCHRIALLWMRGQRVLYPSQYVLQTSRNYVPKDHTSTLLRTLGVEDAEYARFLSLGFGDGDVHDSVAALSASLSELPEREALADVVRIDDNNRGRFLT